jgi:hypothetical protein
MPLLCLVSALLEQAPLAIPNNQAGNFITERVNRFSQRGHNRAFEAASLPQVQVIPRIISCLDGFAKRYCA